MLTWLMKRASLPQPDRGSVRPKGRAMSGEYLLLYRYLEDRYANTVVLTFGEIEDLLGFALPEPARSQQEWWTGSLPGDARSFHTDAWVLASRTARPNLVAGTVAFERAVGC